MATCGEQLVRLLEAYGVDIVFGIPGVHTIELYRGLPQTAIRHITPRHEQGAGFMADGYARVTGRPGVCFIITGPGMTNIATAMGQALQDCIPMLVISSVNHSHHLGLGEGRLHELPSQQAMIAGITRFSQTLHRAAELPKLLARAFAVFESERPGPVHIEIPIDVITSPGDDIDLVPWPVPSPPAPAPDAIRLAAGELQAAARPLIAIGGGAIDASQELVTLAETLDAPVINTVNAKGVVPAGHPLAVGSSGSLPNVRQALQEADVVLALGTQFAETEYDYFFEGDVQIPGRLIRVDIDAQQLTRNVKPDIAICSDARTAVMALNEALTEEPTRDRGGKARADSIRQAITKRRDQRYAEFFETLNEALPGVIIAGDSTQPTYFAWLYYETEAPRRYFHSASGFGTLGYAIPAAIGAKLGAPDEPVVGLIGDGAAQFTLSEIACAVEAQVPVIFLLWNNSGYGEIARFMDDNDIERIGVDIHAPDFLKLAEGFGCAASRARDLDALAAALRVAAEASGPTLIEVRQEDFADGSPAL